MILTPKQKLVVHLIRRQGLRQHEVARALGLTRESVCRLYARARRRLAAAAELAESLGIDRDAVSARLKDRRI